MNIVIDTNILTSALIKDSKTRSLIIKSNQTFLLPEFELIEIKNHKPEILRKSGLSDMEFNSLFVNMLKYVKIIKTDNFIKYKNFAEKIIGDIDKDDVQFIALALAFNCPIWSDDRHFQKQNKIKVITTKE